jgi:hypothetical protein
MKYKHKKTLKLLRFLPLVLITLLFGCDLFLASQKPQDNPLDPNNPTAAVNELKAYGYSASSVKLKWKFESDGDAEYPNVMIVRNGTQAPTTVDDGTLIYTGPTNIAEGSEYAELTDDEAAEETDYYYGIWAYTEQDGTIYYNGPISDTASTKLNEVEIPLSWDGYLRYEDVPPVNCVIDDTIPQVYLLWDNANLEQYILLAFDFTNAPDFGELTEARLRLYKYQDTGSVDWQVSAARIVQEWDSGDPLATRNSIVANSFQDFSDDANAPVIDIPRTSTGYYYWDMADAVISWMADGEPNYGILVRSRTGDTVGSYDFYSRNYSSVSERPALILKYYGDPVETE